MLRAAVATTAAARLSLAPLPLLLQRTPPRRFLSASAPASYTYVLTEKRDRVGLVTLNRPDALNALSSPLMKDLNDALREFDADDSVGAIVLTGSDRAFAAGADIKEMQPLTMVGNIKSNYLGDWT
ncbi:Fatty acid oxidation complex subunit alpha, partial [Cladochytrium tenue]